MSKILITGGAGNVGSALAKSLAKSSGNHIVIADNLTTGDIAKVPSNLPNVVFVKCDVNEFSDISALFYRHDFEFVFHYAAIVGVQRTLDNPLRVLRDIKGIENILQLSKNTGVRRVYFASSSEVYGEPFEIPQNEDTTPLNSRLPYAVVKNVGEVYLRTYFKEFGLSYTIFRFFNTYGPNQSEDFVLPRFVRLAMRDEDIPIYGDGMQTRTFCYVDDNVDACIYAHEKERFANDVVNIGADDEITIKDLGMLVIKIVGAKSKLAFLPALPEGDMTRRRPDNSKMRQLLGREPLPLERGIERLVKYYRDTEAK